MRSLLILMLRFERVPPMNQYLKTPILALAENLAYLPDMPPLPKLLSGDGIPARLTATPSCQTTGLTPASAADFRFTSGFCPQMTSDQKNPV